METLEGATSVERAMMNKAAARGVPINGSLELLPLCNMNCDMCYVRLSRQEMEAQGRIRSGAEWLELGHQMAKAGTLILLLTGGEPLLHPDFKEIYLGLKKMGFILTINTNGTLIDESWAEFFGRNKPRRINITLYGADEKAYETLCHYPGGFDRVIRAVKLLRERKVDVKLAGSITPDNANDIPGMFKMARELDVPLHADTYMMPAARERTKLFDAQSRLLPEQAARTGLSIVREEYSQEAFAVYRDQILREVDTFQPGEEAPCEPGCMAGRCSFTINWQGQLRPCVMQTEPAADVFENGFAESWRRVSNAYLKLRYCADCSVCRLRKLCRPCIAASLMETGDYMGKPEYLCRYAAETERLLRRSREEEKNE